MRSKSFPTKSYNDNDTGNDTKSQTCCYHHAAHGGNCLDCDLDFIRWLNEADQRWKQRQDAMRGVL